MRQLNLAVSLGAVVVLVGPAAAWSTISSYGNATETVGHHNQDRPAWMHHNQDHVVPPFFEIPEPPDAIHDPPGWIGIQDDGRRRSQAPPFGDFGADLDLIVLAETPGTGGSDPTVVVAPLSAIPGEPLGFGSPSLDDLGLRTRDLAAPGGNGLAGAAVPSPGALSLLGLAALGLAGRGRRRRLAARC